MKFLKAIGWFIVIIFVCGAIETLTNIKNPGMNFMLDLYSVLAFIFIVISSLLISTLLSQKLRRLISANKFSKYINKISISICALISLVIMSNISSVINSQQASNLGFSSKEEFQAASKLNYFDVNEYHQHLSEVEQERQIKIAEEKRKEAEEEAKCNSSPICYLNHHAAISNDCSGAVQQLARFEWKWTSDNHFDTASWIDNEHTLILISGYNAKAQNGFGAWSTIHTVCLYDTTKGTVENANWG